jgi:steroid delta-isomerase-like uncharacterized protein
MSVPCELLTHYLSNSVVGVLGIEAVGGSREAVLNAWGNTMATTTTDENKELVHEYLAAWEDEKLDAITILLADDFSTTHTDATGTDIHLDVAGFEDLVSGYFEVFSEFDSEVQRIVAEDERVVARITCSGVHDGEFWGIPATGNHVEVEEFLSFRIEDGKIAGLHYLGDNLALLRQLDIDLPIDA